ncbi:MAG: HemK family protein methyltransferase [Candidatus Pacebacteria bacterium]|nr:HemK family protein methyltransferase [Candidatus Paceibacterota bacterium]MCF7857205.1 HemK family protein methyltransferase [Candidatus Paceibacterota bacterium]
MTQDETWLLKEKYNGKIVEEYNTDCARLKNGEPLAYLIGHIPFINTTIYLDSHPLIPRTETEYWVQNVVDEISDRGLASVRVLDLCAGSGCIGIAVLNNIADSHVDFVEIDTDHHATIKDNVLKNNIDQTRARVFGGNLFENITDTYDYILTNPPYIDPKLDRTTSSVSENEPALALYGGKDGVSIISLIIERADKFLKKSGVLFIEHEPEQVETIHTLAAKKGFFTKTATDQFGTKRFTRLTRTDSLSM